MYIIVFRTSKQTYSEYASEYDLIKTLSRIGGSNIIISVNRLDQ